VYEPLLKLWTPGDSPKVLQLVYSESSFKVDVSRVSAAGLDVSPANAKSAVAGDRVRSMMTLTSLIQSCKNFRDRRLSNFTGTHCESTMA
jgi:hypothetical protein